MKPALFLMVIAAASLDTLSVTRNASALGPVDVEVAAKVGGGSRTTSGAPDALGFGFGARAGVSFFGFYGGLSVMDYLGASTPTAVFAAGAPPGKYSLKSVLYGVEAGYNIGVPFVTLRPQLGVGNYTLTASSTGLPSSSANNLYLEPGVTGLLSFGLWIVGADVNILLLPGMSGSQAAFTGHGQVGIKF
jgi:hypothetical protein